MAILKCKMCGGNLEIIEGSSICVCEYCGTEQTVPNVDDERKVTLFVRANKLRSVNEFDKAYSIYESLTEDFPEEAEAYWGLVLCKYGIEYVDDPKTGKKIPTCHRSSFNSILEDENYLKTLSQCDVLAREVYKKEALAIEELRKGIIEISAKEEPYDIFICYKETDKQGQRTHDSVLAQSIYGELTEKGYRVFFSRISLEDKLGVKYEPYIFSALHSARVMLVVGMDGDNLNAVWVKNEWSRYLKLIEAGKKKTLIPCFKGIDPYDLPEEFADLQAQDMGKIGAMQDLVRGIGKLIPKATVAPTVTATQVTATGPNIENLQKRASMALSDGDFQKADELFEKILEIDNSYALGYLGLDMVRHQAKSCKELALAYAKNRKELSSNLKEAKRLSPNASWIAEFEKEYSVQLASVKEKERRAKEQATEEQIALEKIERVCKVNNGTIVKYDKYNYKDHHLNIPKGINSIGKGAFEFCSSITSITISDGLKEIGKNAFYCCTNLTSITIPNSVTTIGKDAFHCCKSLTNITIPNSVTTIDKDAFYGCTNLTSITIPNGVKKIGEWAFQGCTSLANVTISEGVQEIGFCTFSGCKSLKSISIPNSVTNICYGAFSGCESLKSITIPSSVTKIDFCAFSGCSSLENITIPNSLTIIGSGAFKKCKFAKERKKQGVCIYCGGNYSKMGFFTKICTSCGRKKYK